MPRKRFLLSDPKTLTVFLSNILVDEETMCWNWIGPDRGDKLEYGCFRLNRRSEFAHRVSWMIFKGEIPKGKYILHRCIGNGKCVNPFHLYLGTAKENARDTVVQGRKHTMPGEACKLHKLTDALVIQIRSTPYTWGMYSKLAAQYGISIRTIGRAATGDKWRHISTPPHQKVNLKTVDR